MEPNPTTNRYESINAAWRASGLPPVTREEVTRALAILCRKFGGTQHGGPSMVRPFRRKRVRVCWISLKGGTLDKGWPRLAHDLSHDLFEARHPRLKQHHPAHAAVEREVSEYIIASGWLTGSLKRKAATPSRAERVADKRASVEARLARWETKARRAATAIKKLRRALKSYERRAAFSAPTAGATV